MDPNNQNNNSGTDRDLLNLGNTTGTDIPKDNQSNVNTDNQPRNSHLKKFQFKKGVTGNPAGRPRGKSMKEYAREYLSKMTDEERITFMNALDEDVVWRMAEGQPKQDTDITSGGEPIQPLFDYVSSRNNNSNEQDTKSDEKN